MLHIVWDQSYSVGIHEIDQQHKKLIGLTNDLYIAMKNGKGRESLQLLLEELMEYTQYHFSYEEDLFHKYGYAAKDIHISQHQEFKNRIQQMNITIRSGKGILTVEVFGMLKNWINHHIMCVDKLYQKELTEHMNPIKESDVTE